MVLVAMSRAWAGMSTEPHTCPASVAPFFLRVKAQVLFVAHKAQPDLPPSSPCHSFLPLSTLLTLIQPRWPS